MLAEKWKKILKIITLLVSDVVCGGMLCEALLYIFRSEINFGAI